MGGSEELALPESLSVENMIIPTTPQIWCRHGMDHHKLESVVIDMLCYIPISFEARTEG